MKKRSLNTLLERAEKREAEIRQQNRIDMDAKEASDRQQFLSRILSEEKDKEERKRLEEEMSRTVVTGFTLREGIVDFKKKWDEIDQGYIDFVAARSFYDYETDEISEREARKQRANAQVEEMTEAAMNDPRLVWPIIKLTGQIFYKMVFDQGFRENIEDNRKAQFDELPAAKLLNKHEKAIVPHLKGAALKSKADYVPFDATTAALHEIAQTKALVRDLKKINKDDPNTEDVRKFLIKRYDTSIEALYNWAERDGVSKEDITRTRNVILMTDKYEGDNLYDGLYDGVDASRKQVSFDDATLFENETGDLTLKYIWLGDMDAEIKPRFDVSNTEPDVVKSYDVVDGNKGVDSTVEEVIIEAEVMNALDVDPLDVIAKLPTYTIESRDDGVSKPRYLISQDDVNAFIEGGDSPEREKIRENFIKTLAYQAGVKLTDEKALQVAKELQKLHIPAKDVEQLNELRELVSASDGSEKAGVVDFENETDIDSVVALANAALSESLDGWPGYLRRDANGNIESDTFTMSLEDSVKDRTRLKLIRRQSALNNAITIEFDLAKDQLAALVAKTASKADDKLIDGLDYSGNGSQGTAGLAELDAEIDKVEAEAKTQEADEISEESRFKAAAVNSLHTIIETYEGEIDIEQRDIEYGDASDADIEAYFEAQRRGLDMDGLEL